MSHNKLDLVFVGPYNKPIYALMGKVCGISDI